VTDVQDPNEELDNPPDHEFGDADEDDAVDAGDED